LSLLTSSPTITYLNHSSATVQLTSEAGPKTTFTVFGSPYSLRNGLWAFGYDTPKATADNLKLPTIWDKIPVRTDVVVTHTPPNTHCDKRKNGISVGCEALRRRLWRVRPRLAVCGHVHEGRGVERVRWELGDRRVMFSEKGVERWTDPGAIGNKMSLVDLTSRGRKPLDNDGADPDSPPARSMTRVAGAGNTASSSGESTSQPGAVDAAQTTESEPGDGPDGKSGSKAPPRHGRNETCVVNCAIMAKSYPHTGGKTTNKPIVVDLDLPVWT
jgi:hypothetical protein